MIQLEVTSPFSSYSITSSVPIGTKGKVYVWGYNDIATKQKMGVHWIITDPEGYVAEDYLNGAIDWSFEYVNPNEEHRFYGDRFDIDKLGPWAIAIELFMNPDSPVIVDSYDGVLCTVVAEVPPEIPPEEVPPEINWLPIILIGGGVALAAMVLKPKKTRT